MTLTFKTRSGSTYRLDKNLMRWMRTSATGESGPIRSDGGRLLAWPEISIKEPAVLQVEEHATTPEGCSRLIITSPVVEIKYPLQ